MLKFSKGEAIGVGIAAGVGLVGVLLGQLETHLWGREWIESLVLAILLGMVVRLFWTPSQSWLRGIRWTAKGPLELAIVLLGLSVQGKLLVGQGIWLLLVALIVVGTIGGGVLIGRWLGLPPKLATLVACGNAICGNSAIAAVAPVIQAEEEQVAAAVAFTALGSIVVVLGLPVLSGLLRLSPTQYGTLAGLSVYAVPQVLAATAGAGAMAMQTGVIVKLARVLMLGPVAATLAANNKRGSSLNWRRDWPQMVPPFILGFLLLVVLRSAGAVPASWTVPARDVAGWLTVGAMAALGLAGDPRAVMRAGWRVVATASVSLIGLVTVAALLVRWLGA